MSMNAWVVFGVALGTALATGLGVIPVMATRLDEKRSSALSSAIAGGFMLGASAALFYEGAQRGAFGTLLGAVAGVVFIYLTGRYLEHHPHAHIGNLRGARGVTALIVIGVMT